MRVWEKDPNAGQMKGKSEIYYGAGKNHSPVSKKGKTQKFNQQQGKSKNRVGEDTV